MKKLFTVPALLILFVITVCAFAIQKFDIVQLNQVRYQADNGINYIRMEAPTTLASSTTQTLTVGTGHVGLVIGTPVNGHIATYNATVGQLVDGGAVGATCPGTATNGQVLYDNAGVCGGITNATSNGTTMTLTSPKIVTSILDTNGLTLIGLTATGTAVNNISVANAATGNNPTISASGSDTNVGILFTTQAAGILLTQNTTGTSPGWYSQITGDTVPRVRVGVNAADVASIGFGTGGATRDAFLEYQGTANLREGGPASATPTAQIFSVQNGVGTNIAAAATWDFVGPLGTGTGTNGDFRFRVGVKVGSGTGAPTTTTALTIKGETLQSVFPALSSTTIPTIQVGATATGIGDCNVANNVGIFVNGVCSYDYAANIAGLIIASNRFLSFSNNTSVPAGATDMSFERLSTTAIAVTNGQATCGTVANCRDLAMRHSLANGVVCTIGSGFGAGAAFVDGACDDDSFRLNVGTTPGTTGVITFGTAYANKPSCSATDESTAVITRAVATTTNVTINAVFVNNDIISVVCRGRI